MTTHKLDDQDYAILRLLQQDASQPQREIAEKVHLSAPAVQRRIARLEKLGVIQRTVAIIDPGAVGFPVTVIVNVVLRDDRSTTVAQAKAFYRNAPEVQQCYWAAGLGLIMILTLPSTEAYEDQTARLFGDNDLVTSYSTVVVLDRVKFGTSIPF